MATLAVAFAAWPGTASATLTVNSATLDSVTSTSSPPGSVLPAQVKGNATNETWRGTQYRFGTGVQQCVNTTSVTGDASIGLNVTAPGEPGDYDAGFTARGEDNCTGSQSNEFTLRTP